MLRRCRLACSRPVRLATAGVLLSCASPALAAAEAFSWPRGQVVVPSRLFQSNNELDKVILESNPRIILNRDFDPKADLILVVGMDGWGGRSENFVGTLYYGLKGNGLTRRLVLAAIQDPKTRGPRYQGQGDAEHANVWSLEDETIPALRRFVHRLAQEFGHLRVYFMGYSTGSAAAPSAAVRVAALGPTKEFSVEGAICLGTGASIGGARLKDSNIRVLFLVVPKARAKEPKARRNDQTKRASAEAALARITQSGGTAYLRHITSARRHNDWHWGLMSQCRYFRSGRYDDGRGYWPNYWMPNPESFGHMAVFIQGRVPPESLSPPLQRCPHPPNPLDTEDPDAKVRDPSRQTIWPPGTVPGDKGEPR